MGWWTWLVRRAGVLARKGDAESELDDEIRHHLEMEILENLRSGMSPAEARREAMKAFGGVERFKEEVRDVRGARILDDLVQDTRVALRSLPKQPAFVLAIVATLAVGIGGSVATFSVLDAALLEALPYPESDRLVLGRATFDGRLGPYVSAYDYEDYRAGISGLEALGAIAPFPARVTLTGEGAAERLDRVVVSHDFFRALGVDPILGRHFLPEEANREGEPVILLSHGYWQRRFGGDPGVVGRTVTLDGIQNTIVGVMPAGFRFYLDTDTWRPYNLGRDYAGSRRNHNFLLVGRLAPGSTLERVRAEADGISAALEEAYPESNEGKALLVTPLQDSLVEGYMSTLGILSVSALLILLVACANAAGLLLARGTARRAELSVRSAMGAGGARLVRQLLTESALLAGVAGVVGVLLGAWAQKGAVAFLSPDRLGELSGGLSLRTVAFALALSVGTVLLFGLLPSLRAARTDPANDLRSGSRTVGSLATARFRNGLVVGQIALTSVLLAISGLLIRSFQEARHVDLGFDARDLVTAEIQVPASYGVEERVSFFEELEGRIQGVAGVESVALASHLPVRDPGNTYGIQRAEAGSDGDLRNVTAGQRIVMPGYFQRLGIPLVAGRPIQLTDRAGAERVVVLSESTARHLFGDEPAVGREVMAGGVDRDFVRHRVVGVVSDVVLDHPLEGLGLAMYFAQAQVPRPRERMAIRVRGDAGPVVGGVRRILEELDPNVPLDDVLTMDEAVAASVADRRALSVVLAVFALTALCLAAVGLYGVLAYQVSLRLREIGIRMALGASARRVTSGVVRAGLRLVAVGFVLGIVAALWAGGLLEGMLFGVGGQDPVTFVALAVVLGGVGTLACALPARRAARVSPVEVMRME